MMSVKQFWLQFFELYKSLPAVWKTNSFEYRNRTKKDKAYNLLIEKCKQIAPDADRVFVIRKINSFRCSYRKEQKKVDQQLMLGNIYKPTLWYFNHLSFLKDQDENFEQWINELDNEDGNKGETMANATLEEMGCDFKYKTTFKDKTDERKFWREFLELYKSLPALWKLNSEEYKSKSKKDSAYNILVEKCKEVVADADRSFVNKKIRNFRVAYIKELKRVEQEFKAGYDYKPALWCYESLSFLKNQHDNTEEFYREYDKETKKIEETNDTEQEASLEVSDTELATSNEHKVAANKRIEKSIKQFWIEFFELYKNLPAVWKRSCNEYKDRNRKAMAYKALIKKCQEIDAEADRNFVIKKINNFRCAYRKEQKKVKRACMLGNNYKPSLWYYNLLGFVDNQEEDAEQNSENEHFGDENNAETLLNEEEFLSETDSQSEVGENEETFEMIEYQCKGNIENLELFWSEFFELYQSLPALWNIESKEYKDQHKKLIAYNVLIEKYKKLNPNADKVIVVRKIKALRSLYGKELINVEREKMLENDYKPALWYFPHLSFLENCFKTKTNEDKVTLQEDQEDFPNENYQKFWSEFFELLKSLPALWQTKSKEYQNRYKRFIAYNVLIKKCKEIHPTADKDFVVNKINDFRSAYRIEVVKIKQETMLGHDYKPSLWCFQHLSFLEEDSNEVFKKFWLHFFELFKSLPALWKMASEEYKDRYRKDEAYNLLISKCKEINPNADRDFVTRKIQGFRNVFNKERKKVLRALMVGREYKPSLWYFDHLDFLKDQEDPLELSSLTKNEPHFEDEGNCSSSNKTYSEDKFSSLKAYERKFWSEFIELYKSLPAMWKTKSDEYKDQNKRTMAFNILIKKCKEINSVADKVIVAKKISNFRNTYKREQKRVVQALEAGREYKPSVWYFDQLDFLKNEEDPLEVTCQNRDTKNEHRQDENSLSQEGNLSNEDKHFFRLTKISRLKEYERKFWLEFLELYKNLPAVWKTKSDEYKDRNEKNMAYDILIKKCREIEPNASRDFVVRKINVFRCSYRKEVKKVEQKSRSGIEYKPSLWHFDILSFLENQEDSLEESFNDNDWENNLVNASEERNFRHNLSANMRNESVTQDNLTQDKMSEIAITNEEVKFQENLSQAVGSENDFDYEMDKNTIKIEEEHFQENYSNLANNESESTDYHYEEKVNEKAIKMEEESNEIFSDNYPFEDKMHKNAIKIEEEDFQEDLSNATSNQSDFEGFQSDDKMTSEKKRFHEESDFEDSQYDDKMKENSMLSGEESVQSDLSNNESDIEGYQSKDKMSENARTNSTSNESDFEDYQYENQITENNIFQETLSQAVFKGSNSDTEDLRQQNQYEFLDILPHELIAESDTKEDSTDFEILPYQKTFWSEFLELYQNLPAVWESNSDEYNNETKKSQAYKILIEKCKEIEPKADQNFVLRKINNFRILLRKEHKKVEEELMNGNDYKPPFWYFDCLNFLNDEKHSLETLCQESGDGNKQNDDKYTEKSHSDVQDRPHTSSLKKKKYRPTNSDELLELATKRLKRCDDYSQTLANVWASEFRLASQEQKFFAKKAIDDILFEARLGTLHRNSVKINESPMNNEYSEFNSKRESYNCGSPESANNSVSIERVGIDNHENDIC